MHTMRPLSSTEGVVKEGGYEPKGCTHFHMLIEAQKIVTKQMKVPVFRTTRPQKL